MSPFLLGKGRSHRTLVTAVAGILVAAVLAAVLGVVLVSRSQTAARDATMRFPPGTQTVYALEASFSTEASVAALLGVDDADGAPGLESSVRATVRGALEVSVLEDREGRVVTAWRVVRPEVDLVVNDAPAVEEGRIVAGDLARTTFLLMDQDGRIESLWLDPAVAEVSRPFVHALAAAGQVVLPRPWPPQSAAWEVREEDVQDRWTTRYEVLAPAAFPPDPAAAAAPITIRKTRIGHGLHDTSPQPHSLDAPTTVEPDGEVIVEVDARTGRLLELRGTERVTTRVSGRPVGQSHRRQQLTRHSEESLARRERRALQAEFARRESLAPAAVPLMLTRDDHAQQRRFYQRDLGEETLESLLNQLVEAEQSGASDEVVTELFVKFTALAWLHPEVSPILERLLLAADGEDLGAYVLASALGAAGHVDAQAALAGVLRARSDDWPLVAVIVPALADVEHPTLTAEEALWRLALHESDWNVRTTAELALGTVANRLAAAEPSRAGRIVEYFRRRAERAADEGEIRQALLVLGNTASPAAGETIAGRLAHSAPQVRTAAAWALRWVGGADAQARLAEAFQTDPAPEVRLEAAAALAHRPRDGDWLEVHRQVLRNDAHADVRRAALGNLWEARSTFPDAIADMTHAAENDPDADLRAAAQRLIGAAEPAP